MESHAEAGAGMNNAPIPPKPPALSQKWLRLFLKKEYLEEIEGDLEELFSDQAEQVSVRRANLRYTLEVLKLMRPSLTRLPKIDVSLPHPAMFRNYFKVSIRGLLKHPLNSFINIFGLSAAIGFCIFGYAFARWVYSTDQFHELKNEVYLVTFFANRDGAVQEFGGSPRPLGAMLRDDFAQIRRVCRIDDRPAIVKYEGRIFHEKVRYTDPEFLQLFTFPMKWGTSASLGDVNSIVLSENISKKYFGEENPVGRSIVVKSGKERDKSFTVTGVAKEFPKSRTISFDFLVNFRNLVTADPAYDVHDWTALLRATFIQVEHPEELAGIRKGMDKYLNLQHAVVRGEWQISSFGFEPLATLHERSEYIRDGISRSSKDNYVSVIYIAVIGALLLILASLNYINIAVASAAKRLKEIAIRKTIGATRFGIAVQFLSENVVVTFFALVIGFLLAKTFFIPGFETLWSFSMDFRFTDAALWIFLPAVVLATAVVSGIYPSLYVSRFQVVGIIKGSLRFGRKNPLTKVFLCIQLILSCILIASAVLFTENADYMAKRSWGYHPSDVVYAELPDGLAFDELNAAIAQNPNVLSVSGSKHHLGRAHARTVVTLPERRYETDEFAVDAGYLETMGVQLSRGRTFIPDQGGDREKVVINESLASGLPWDNPLGHHLRINDVAYEIIGVVDDFHSDSFYNRVRPSFFRVAEKTDFRFLSIRTRPGTGLQTYRALQSAWSALFPDSPFEGGRQEDVWGGYWNELGIHGLVWRVIAGIAICLASLGLYGLVTLNVEGRRREFSIRKVLGAGLGDIGLDIGRPYAVLFAVGLALGAPISYLLIKLLFDSAYAYHMPVDASGSAAAVFILLAVLLITVSTQIRHVLKVNPVDGLKTE